MVANTEVDDKKPAKTGGDDTRAGGSGGDETARGAEDRLRQAANGTPGSGTPGSDQTRTTGSDAGSATGGERLVGQATAALATREGSNEARLMLTRGGATGLHDVTLEGGERGRERRSEGGDPTHRKIEIPGSDGSRLQVAREGEGMVVKRVGADGRETEYRMDRQAGTHEFRNASGDSMRFHDGKLEVSVAGQEYSITRNAVRDQVRGGLLVHHVRPGGDAAAPEVPNKTEPGSIVTRQVGEGDDRTKVRVTGDDGIRTNVYQDNRRTLHVTETGADGKPVIGADGQPVDRAKLSIDTCDTAGPRITISRPGGQDVTIQSRNGQWTDGSGQALTPEQLSQIQVNGRPIEQGKAIQVGDRTFIGTDGTVRTAAQGQDVTIGAQGADAHITNGDRRTIVSASGDSASTASCSIDTKACTVTQVGAEGVRASLGTLLPDSASGQPQVAVNPDAARIFDLKANPLTGGEQATLRNQDGQPPDGTTINLDPAKAGLPDDLYGWGGLRSQELGINNDPWLSGSDWDVGFNNDGPYSGWGFNTDPWGTEAWLASTNADDYYAGKSIDYYTADGVTSAGSARASADANGSASDAVAAAAQVAASFSAGDPNASNRAQAALGEIQNAINGLTPGTDAYWQAVAALGRVQEFLGRKQEDDDKIDNGNRALAAAGLSRDGVSDQVLTFASIDSVIQDQRRRGPMPIQGSRTA